jgi:hypothetical protein
MLTDVFYQRLAGMLKGGPQSWGPLSIAVGQGQVNWDRTPPLLQRSRTALTAELGRKAVNPGNVQFVNAAGDVSAAPTARLRVQTTFAAGEGSGTLRECGLWMGEGDGAALLAYFIHPRVEKAASATLLRSMLLDLTPGRPFAQEIQTRYLGNSQTEEFHDVENKKKSCQLEEIRIDRRHYFNSIDEALNLGYDRCAFCFGRAQSTR